LGNNLFSNKEFLNWGHVLDNETFKWIERHT